MHLLSSVSLLLAASTAYAQIPAGLQPSQWRQNVFQGCCGTEEMVDGNPSTASHIRGEPPGHVALLFNFKDIYLGFYILSGGPNYITDYDIVANDIEYGQRVVGRVTGATSNFTVVNFYNAEGYPEIFSDIIYLNVHGLAGNSTANTTATVAEIWPIYGDEEIHYPPGQSASPSPTQPGVPYSTRATPTPTAPYLRLNRWPSRPSAHIGNVENTQVVTDQNLDTKIEYPLVSGEDGALMLLSHGWFDNMAGIYVVSGGVDKEDNYLQDYHVVMRNWDTFEWHEVCRVTSATSNFTLCPFFDEKGNKGYTSWVMQLYSDQLSGSGNKVRIHEIYPIWASDHIIDPETVPGGVYGEKAAAARLS